MDLNLLTVSSRNIVYQAKQIAVKLSNDKLDVGHLGLAIFRYKTRELTNIFEKFEVDPDKIEKKFFDYLKRIKKANYIQKLSYTKYTEELFAQAINYKILLKEEKVSATNLLISLCETREETIQSYLVKNNLTPSTIIELIERKRNNLKQPKESYTSEAKEINLLNKEVPTFKKTPVKINYINEFCVNLVDKAKADKIDPVIGRDEELRSLIQILLRRRKNNPLLIGPAGVGKTAIIEALAKRIFEGDIPDKFKNIKLLELDLGKMIAGTKLRGDFEKRIKGVVQAIYEVKDGVFLFIDEIHTIIGAGASEGGLDASNMLKPALARGELNCIGATTLKEYKKYLEPDSALVRRFQTVSVAEPDIKSCIGILRGLKEKYEIHHGVRIKDEAIIAASELSDKYISDRYLPDKAIDLIDESASKIRMEIDSMPVDIDLLNRKILQLEIEKTALNKEKDNSSKKRIAEIKVEIDSKKEKRDKSKKQWEEEKSIILQSRKIKKELEKKKKEELIAQRAGDLETAASIRYGDLTRLERELKEVNKKMDDFGENKFLKEEVGKAEVCAIISKWTGIPLEKMLLSEKEKFKFLERQLEKRVIGQEIAINAVANSVRRARTYVDDPRKPSGSFFFFGPTGVGKTELVKALADLLFNDEKVIVRLDMSEYMEKHTISRLIGAPPGYVGYGEGGLLTEAIYRNPYSIVLFDEIEKGHPDVFNILLQILDEGNLTDSKGLKVNFKNSIIILTSNFGSEFFFEKSRKLTPSLCREILLKKFKPELLNRIDEIIPFYPLKEGDIMKIINIHFTNVQKNLLNQNINISITKEALIYLAQIGFDREFGARPLRRIVQKELLDIIAYKIIDDTIKENDKIEVRYQDNRLTLHRVYYQ